MCAVPENLIALEAAVIFGDYGGIRADGDHLFWYNGWVGDAPGEDPKETTTEAAREAEAAVVALGYTTRNRYVEHDHAQFDIDVGV